MNGFARDASRVSWNVLPCPSGFRVAVSGSLCRNDALELAECLARLDRGDITLDVSRLEAIDVPSAAALAAVRYLRRRRGDHLVVLGARPRIEWILKLRGVDVELCRNEQADREDGLAATTDLVASKLRRSPFTIDLVEAEPGRSVLRFAGTLDQSASERLRRWAKDAIDAPSRVVTVECADLEAIDSTGARLLGEFVIAMTDRQRCVHLQHVRPAIRDALELHGALAEWTTELVQLDLESGD